MSTDPWIHELLSARVREHVSRWQGKNVAVHQFMHPRPVTGTLLRGDTSLGAVVIAGYGLIPVAQIDYIEES